VSQFLRRTQLVPKAQPEISQTRSVWYHGKRKPVLKGRRKHLNDDCLDCTANKKPDALAGVRLCVFRDLCFWRGLGLRGGRRLGGAGGRAVGHVEPVFAELLFAAFEQAEQHVARGGHEPAHGVLVQLAGLTERDVALLRRLFRLLIQIIG